MSFLNLSISYGLSSFVGQMSGYYSPYAGGFTAAQMAAAAAAAAAQQSSQVMNEKTFLFHKCTVKSEVCKFLVSEKSLLTLDCLLSIPKYVIKVPVSCGLLIFSFMCL